MPARLFTALLPPLPVEEALAEFIDPRRDADPAWRWMRADTWHITTAFAPAVAEASIERWSEGLDAVAARTAPIDVRVAGAGCFPHPVGAKLLYLAASPQDQLGRLAASCRQAGSRAGIEVDGSRFVPHLTVARARRPIEATRWLRVLDAFAGATWRAEELALVQSHLLDRGNRYEVLAQFQFQGRDSGAMVDTAP